MERFFFIGNVHKSLWNSTQVDGRQAKGDVCNNMVDLIVSPQIQRKFHLSLSLFPHWSHSNDNTLKTRGNHLLASSFFDFEVTSLYSTEMLSPGCGQAW